MSKSAASGQETFSHPAQRFSDRVENYLRFRPGYPEAMVSLLITEARLAADSIIADVGSGTGISAELLLRCGYEVFAVEPNDAMRAAAERVLGDYTRFHSVPGSAEATTLASESVDLITAGQAFHWFDLKRARDEFKRILRRGGTVALFWNSRRTGATPFLQAYEALLREFGTDYTEVRHENLGPQLLRAFVGGGTSRVFRNEQVLDYEALQGRLLSSSYAPAAGHPQHKLMLQELKRIFDTYHEDGSVRVLYDTELYIGPLA